MSERPARPVSPARQPAGHGTPIPAQSYRKRSAALLASGLLVGTLTACGGSSPLSPVLSLWGPAQPKAPSYSGVVVADEPQAALAAQEVLDHGGNAADAAAALGMALSVTLPSRASLGGGGACLAWRPGEEDGQAFLFLPTSDAATPGADRPASAPMLARGLFMMQLRYGSVDFADTLPPAIRLARNGTEVSTQLASDLAEVQTPLLADEATAAIFGRGDGTTLKAGDMLVQPRLAGSLERIRSAGVGDLFTGALAQTFTAGSTAAGGGLSVATLRGSLPAAVTPLTVSSHNMRVSFLPPPADGGLGTAAAFRMMEGGQTADSAMAANVVAAWRSHVAANAGSIKAGEAQAMLDSGRASGGGTLPNLPASTSFAVADKHGGAVACAVTMDNLFGTGRVAGSTGIVLGASAARRPVPLLTAAIAHRSGSKPVAVVTASGQNQAADMAASALTMAVAGNHPATPATSSGRANVITCSGDSDHCTGWTDPRGAGLATGVR